MNYNLLGEMGLENMDLTYLFIGAFAAILLLLIVVIVLSVNLGRLSKKYKKFMGGKNAKSLEKDIMGLYEDNKLIKASMEKNRKDIENLYRKLAGSFQKMGLVKYDAFNQMGGQLSFPLRCWMKTTTDLLSIPFTARKAATPIQRKSKTDYVIFHLATRRKRLLTWLWICSLV